MARLKNRKHELFCRHYIAKYDASAAYLAAGFNNTPYLRQNAYSLLRRADITARVNELDDRALRLADVTVDKAKMELSRVAFCDPRRMFDADGTPIHPSQWPDDLAAAVASIKVTSTMTRQAGAAPEDPPLEVKTTTTEVRFWSKTAALQIFAEHFKLVGPDPDDAERNVSDMGERMLRAQQRVRLHGRSLTLVNQSAAAGDQ